MEKQKEIKGSMVVDLMAVRILPRLLRINKEDYSIPKNVFKAAVKVVRTENIL